MSTHHLIYFPLERNDKQKDQLVLQYGDHNWLQKHPNFPAYWYDTILCLMNAPSP